MATLDEITNFIFPQAYDQGWNPLPQDIDTLLKIDSSGFYVALLDAKPVVCIGAIK